MGFWPSYDFFKESGVLQKCEDGDLKEINVTDIWSTFLVAYDTHEYDTPKQANIKSLKKIAIMIHLSKQAVRIFIF